MSRSQPQSGQCRMTCIVRPPRRGAQHDAGTRSPGCRGSPAACHDGVSEEMRPPTSGPACEMIIAVSPKLEESVFLSACRRQAVPYTPVWFMRQAGRSLPEYQAARRRTSMVEACTKPDLVTELTLQPLRRYPVDAAILFSDIVVPLRAAGVGIDIRPGVGPVVEQPICEEGDLQRLRLLAPGDVHYVAEAVEALVAELDGTPLIGFAGGPVTLASDLIDGGPAKDFGKTQALMDGKPPLAGSGVPRLHFGVSTGELLGMMGEAGADVVGVDWRVPLDEAVRRVEPGKALQGNLDPAILLAPWEVIEHRALQVLDAGRTAEGHVFNLGHGVLPETDPDVLARLTELEHTASALLPGQPEGATSLQSPAAHP